MCLRHRSHPRPPAVTTFGQHLHASDTGLPKWGCGEESSSIFNKFIPNCSLGEGWGWWSPALPARPWLCHLHPLKGRACSPLPPHQPTPASSEHCPGLLGHLDKSWLQGLGSSSAVAALSRAKATGAKFPPALWNYEPGTVVRPHHACFSPSCLGRVHQPSW